MDAALRAELETLRAQARNASGDARKADIKRLLK
jgi:hypothetical protein